MRVGFRVLDALHRGCPGEMAEAEVHVSWRGFSGSSVQGVPGRITRAGDLLVYAALVPL